MLAAAGAVFGAVLALVLSFLPGPVGTDTVVGTIGYILSGWRVDSLPAWSIGFVYLLVALGLIAGSYAALMARYRKAGL